MFGLKTLRNVAFIAGSLSVLWFEPAVAGHWNGHDCFTQQGCAVCVDCDECSGGGYQFLCPGEDWVHDCV
jgi:hypothetical protein